MARGIVPFGGWGPMRDLDRFFEEDFWAGNFVPAVDIFQDKDNVIVQMDAPNIDAEKIDIAVENDVLTVSGAKEEKHEVKREDYYRKEIRSGSFSRSVILPMAVEGEKAQAEYKKGVLSITLPKAERAKAKKINVAVKD